MTGKSSVISVLRRIGDSEIILSCGLFLFVFVAYLPTMWFGFVWDDIYDVLDNESIRSVAYIGRYFTDPYTFSSNPTQAGLAAWRPFRNISYLIDYLVNGLNPTGFHLHNLLLQGIVAVLLYLFYIRCLRIALPVSRQIILLASWIGAALWAVHPVQTEVVAWVKSRDDLLVDMFILLSLHASLSVLLSRKVLMAYIASILFLILAALSKDNGVLVPGIVFCMPFIFSESRKIYRSRKFLLLVGGQGVVAVIIIVLRAYLMKGVAQGEYLTGSFSSMMLTMVPAYARYFQLIFWPFPPTSFLSDYFAYPMEYSLLSSRLWFSMAADLVAVGGLIFICRRHKVAWFGLVFFSIAMLPYTNLIPMVQVIAERFLNLPLAGLGLIIAAILSGIRTRNMRRWAFGFSIFLLMGYTICNVVRQQVWRNDYTLAKDAYFKNTNLRTSICYIGALSDIGNTTESLRVANYTLQIFPDSLEIQMSMATTFIKQGRMIDGKKILKGILSKYPNNSKVLFMLSELYFREKDFSGAKRILTAHTHYYPHAALAWYNLAYANFRLGDKTEAMDAIRKCRQIDPHTIGMAELEKKIELLKQAP